MKKQISKAVALLMAILLTAGYLLGALPATSVSANGTIKVTVTHPEMNTIKLSWEQVSGATGYNIYYSSTENGTYELVSSIRDTNIIFDNLTTDEIYYFKVVSYVVKNGVLEEGNSSEILKVNANRIGIDVSKWQGDIDWKKVKAAGIEFAFVRVAYGTSTTAEQKYKRNLEGANSQGIPVGVYIYSTATTVAQVKKEAEYVLKLIKGYDITYPVAYDIEDAKIQGKLTKSQNNKLVKTFFDVIEAAGYDTVLYTGCSFSSSKLNMSELKEYDWWIPHYGSSTSYVPYAGKYHFKAATDKNKCSYYNTRMRFWQYSERGKVSGVNGNTDMNYELHVDEPMDSSVYVDLKTGKETYVAGDGETVEAIADKIGVSVTNLLKLNSKYESDHIVPKGKSIAVDTEALGIPKFTVEVDTATSIKLTYDEVVNGTDFEIYCATSATGTFNKIAETTETSYIHKGLSSSKTYYYKVIAHGVVDGEEQSTASIVKSLQLKINKPADVTAVSTSYNSNKITWSPVAGATGYQLYSSTSKTGTYKLIKTTSNTYYTHKNLKNKQNVYYKVKAYIKGTTSNLESSYSSRVVSKPVQAVPSSVYVSNASDTSIKLTFKKSANASYYTIYRATSKTGKYKKVTDVKTTYYTDKNLSKNKTYYYKVRAYRTVGTTNYASDYTYILEASTGTVGPKIATVTGYSKRVYLTWDAVKNAAGYEVYRSTTPDGTYKLVTSKTTRTVNNTGLSGETTYYYKVRSYSLVNKKKVFSNYSEIKSVKTLK